jgi:nicotinamidase/pyrazinamidase
MKTVFFDVDTQLDFLVPSGALYVPGAESIIPALARLNRHAKENAIPLISTVDAHSEADPEFQTWPPHCVSGTWGQRKPAELLHGQILLEKQSLNCFSVPALAGMLREIGAGRAVVYGVVTEICVRNAAWGLLDLGYRVEWVTDACRSLSPSAEQETFNTFTARGGVLTALSRVLA